MADSGGGQKIEEVVNQDDKHYQNPLGVSTDEDGPEDFVRVNVIFPGLKKKLLKNDVANGTLSLEYDTRSLTLLLTMRNKHIKTQEDSYRYHVERLPHDIDKTKSYHKVKEGQVVLYLRKLKPGSWARELSETGLETHIEEDQQDET